MIILMYQYVITFITILFSPLGCFQSPWWCISMVWRRENDQGNNISYYSQQISPDDTGLFELTCHLYLLILFTVWNGHANGECIFHEQIKHRANKRALWRLVLEYVLLVHSELHQVFR